MTFKVDTVLPPGITAARDAAKSFEAIGYDGLYTVETTNDPFIDLAIPAVETTKPMPAPVPSSKCSGASGLA